MHRLTLTTAIAVVFAALAFVSTGCEEKKAETEAESNESAESAAAEGEAAEGTTATDPGAAAEGEAPAEGEGGAESGDKAKLVHQPGAQLGDHTMCPIMGGEFEVTADSPSVEHEGKKVFFCCKGCDSKFQEDPAGKLAELNEKIDAANAE